MIEIKGSSSKDNQNVELMNNFDEINNNENKEL